ncbi:MAG: TolC family protein [Bacteroidales bacterium]|jgi:outer membrane protein TolC|nr:TolC family protein [Bacteroidales bacterium]
MKLKYIIGILLLTGGMSLQGQNYLSLDSCRRLALENNNKSKSAQMQFKKMRYEVNAYRANFFPRISAQGMYLFTTGDFNYHNRFDMYKTNIPSMIGSLPLPEWAVGYLDQFYKALYADIDLTVKPNNTFLAGITFEQPVFMGGKITAAYKMSKIGREMAQLNLELTDAEVILKTDEAYWQYVKVIELYTTALKYKEVVENVCTDAQNGMEAGMIAQNDLMKAQVKLGDAKLMLRQAENGKRLAQTNLCMVTGMNLFTEILPLDTLSDELPLALLDNMPEVTSRIEYRLLKKQLELKKQQVNLSRSDFLPQLGITGGYNYLNGVMLNDTKLFDKASFSAIVSLKIPLTQWGEGVNRIRSAKADLYMAEYQLQETANLLQLEIMQAYNTLDETILKTDIARLEHQQTTENLRIANDRYELGLETLSALLEAQVLWQQARNKYIEAKASLRTVESDYLRISGKRK